MQIFISGTDTNVGKTFVCSWLCAHTHYSYFKPIQTGLIEDRDSSSVYKLTGTKIYPESYCYKASLSPHLAAALEGEKIDLKRVLLPKDERLIVEGAGGLLVPLNKKYLVIDLIACLNLPVIIVARSNLGTINHTLLSVQALRVRNIPLLGVIMNGYFNEQNQQAIEFYGKVSVLAQLPFIDKINKENLIGIPLTKKIQRVFKK